MGIFTDTESSIVYYEWAVGSRPGYNDKMEFTVTTDVCATSSPASDLDLHEGHAYFINVRVSCHGNNF